MGRKKLAPFCTRSIVGAKIAGISQSSNRKISYIWAYVTRFVQKTRLLMPQQITSIVKLLRE